MKYIALLLIKFYRKCISPLFPAKCKYYPTCSSYALTAFRKFGFFRGFLLSGWRIMRCNPWSPGGIDHVPEKFTLRTRKMQFDGLHDDMDDQSCGDVTPFADSEAQENDNNND